MHVAIGNIILKLFILFIVFFGPSANGGSNYGVTEPGDTPYDLSGFDIHFEVTWPTEPATTATINVPGDMSFKAATATSGSRIVVADNYSGAGRTSGWGNDIDIVMSNSATVSGINFNDAQRIRWTGGTVTGGMNGNGFRDILINNVHVFNDSGSATNWAVTQVPFQRLALINSTFDSSGGWGIFVRPTSNYATGPRHRDMIVANSITRTAHYQAARIMSVVNLVVVDSVGLNSAFPQSSWRIHYNSQNVYFENTIGRGLFLLNRNPSDSGPQVSNAVFRNHHQYQDKQSSQQLFNHAGADNSGDVYDSKIHWTGGAGSVVGISPFLDGGGNSRVAWDGSTIDYSEMPGKNSLSDYGADDH